MPRVDLLRSSSFPRLVYPRILIHSTKDHMEPSLSPIKSFRGHSDYLNRVVFSKQGNELRIISTCKDKTVRIWDVETANQVGDPFEGHGCRTCGLAVSMDGRRIVSGAEDGRVIIWDADTKEIIRCLSHHTDYIGRIQFSPDEKRLASASDDGTLKIWDVGTGELVFDIDDHQDEVWGVAYSPNGTKIASSSKDCTIRIWSAATGKQQTQPLIHDSPVSSIVWSLDSRRIISACHDGQIYFWSAPTGAQLGSPLRAHSDAIITLAISPDSELIGSASVDGTAMLWRTTTRKPFGLVLQHAKRVSAIAFSPNGQLVATGGRENIIFLWDISQESNVMTNVVSASFISPASNLISYIDQPSASSDDLSASSAPAPDELPDGTEFPPGNVGLHHAATSPSLSLPSRDHSHDEISTALSVEPPHGIQVPLEVMNSRDAAASPPPSLPPPGSSHPQIAAAFASSPVLASPRKSFLKRFPMFDRSAASVDSKWWKFPRIGNIMQRLHRNVEPQADV